MSTYEPALLYVSKITRRRSRRRPGRGVSDPCPERGFEGFTMLVNGQRVIGVCMTDVQICLKKIKIVAADVRHTWQGYT